MAATRVRVLVEFRNGDGNYHRTYHAKGKCAEHENGFVPCVGELDVEAVERAFIVWCKADSERVARMRKFFEATHKPSHD